MRVLAVDWGERRIGLAVSDPTGLVARALPTLTVAGREEAIRGVASVARETGSERIVVGLPLLMSGEKGEAARDAERFAAELEARIDLPVHMYDERLTSALSQRRLRERGVRARRDKGTVDAGAAVALLESYLQRLAAQRNQQTG